MLDLNKREPSFFIEYKDNNSDCYRYADIDFGIKSKLRENIIQEQSNQCFYCEKKIDNNRYIHIDHIKQRGAFHTLECEYNNMIMSCDGSGGNHCAKFKDQHGIWDDEKYIKLIPENPQLAEKPSDFFRFVSNGKIVPKKGLTEERKRRAKNTRNYLNLNYQKLVEARRKIIGQIDIYRGQGLNTDTIFNYFGEFQSLFN
ncbi:MAG: TIGR02646 family protein [Candidatus Marinimicrobia bacterium]|nr:TIGR02646 family protein [Candidatus Neomarinimicrobiota bacterium]